jgi:hypothetical protein
MSESSPVGIENTENTENTENIETIENTMNAENSICDNTTQTQTHSPSLNEELDDTECSTSSQTISPDTNLTATAPVERKYAVVFFAKYYAQENPRPSEDSIQGFFNMYGQVDHVECPAGKNFAFIYMNSLSTQAEKSKTKNTMSAIIQSMTPETRFHLGVASMRYQNNGQSGQSRQPRQTNYNRPPRQFGPNDSQMQNNPRPPRQFGPNDSQMQNNSRPPRQFDQNRQSGQYDPNRPPRQYDPNRPPKQFDSNRPPRQYDPNRPPRQQYGQFNQSNQSNQSNFPQGPPQTYTRGTYGLQSQNGFPPLNSMNSVSAPPTEWAPVTGGRRNQRQNNF